MTNLEEAIDLVHLKYDGRVFSDYAELARIINENFNTEVTEQDIWDYYEELCMNEIEDKQIHSKVLGLS